MAVLFATVSTSSYSVLRVMSPLILNLYVILSEVEIS